MFGDHLRPDEELVAGTFVPGQRMRSHMAAASVFGASHGAAALGLESREGLSKIKEMQVPRLVFFTPSHSNTCADTHAHTHTHKHTHTHTHTGCGGSVAVAEGRFGGGICAHARGCWRARQQPPVARRCASLARFYGPLQPFPQVPAHAFDQVCVSINSESLSFHRSIRNANFLPSTIAASGSLRAVG